RSDRTTGDLEDLRSACRQQPSLAGSRIVGAAVEPAGVAAEFAEHERARHVVPRPVLAEEQVVDLATEHLGVVHTRAPPRIVDPRQWLRNRAVQLRGAHPAQTGDVTDMRRRLHALPVAVNPAARLGHVGDVVLGLEDPAAYGPP